MAEDVLLEISDRVARVTLNRPDRLNTMAIETVDALCDALAEVGASDARVVVLAGNGRVFCAGADQAEMFERSAGDWERIVRRYLDPVRALISLPQPVIAALHGDAVGGGFGLALACDIRVAAEGVRLGSPFVPIGLAGCDMAAGWFLPRYLGLGRATELMMTGRLIKAAEAFELGLVTQVAAVDQFETATQAWVDRLAAGPPLAQAWTKRAIHRSLNSDMEAEFEFEILAQVQCLQTADHREGIAAFRQKRRPEFSGE
ncbi:MAG: enoyl-CoA hydratase-related protein [Candidatus Nanopelagicales bacterium]|nr:enoyl-CoA hydratase-related protein [Candidatus Nanopelagicales bacterium]